MKNTKHIKTKRGIEIFKLSNGKAVPVEKRFDQGIPAYGGNGISWYTNEILAEQDTLVIGRVGFQSGNVHFARAPLWITDNAMYISSLDNKCYDIIFLCALMEHIDFTRYQDAGDLKKITQKPFMNTEFIAPPIEMQKKYVSFVEQTDKSRFVEMFGDPILNPKGWEMTTIGEIVTEVKYGTSRPAIDGGKYAYLRMNNLTYDGYLDLADLKRIDIPDSEIEKCIVRKGDVLFNRTNSIELVGKTCVFDKDEDMIIAGYIIRVRLKPVMLPLIMSYFMNTDALKKKLRSMAKGAVNQANINAQELKAIKIYLPPTDLQQQFADFVAQTDKSKYCLVGEQILGKAEMLIELLNQEYFG